MKIALYISLFARLAKEYQLTSSQSMASFSLFSFFFLLHLEAYHQTLPGPQWLRVRDLGMDSA